MKRGDNLQPEGEFQKRPDQEWAPGERANIVKRDDNLQPEGEFQKRPDQKWAPGKFLHVELSEYYIEEQHVLHVFSQKFRST